MNVNEFKEKFQRTEENQMGINTNVTNSIVDFIEGSKECKDENVKYFLDNFDKIDKVYQNFRVFESKDANGFMYLFKALNLTKDADNFTIGHEIGHVLNSMKNLRFVDPEHSLKTQIVIPENFEKIVDNAKANCLLPENKEFFKEYVEHICKDKDISIAEKGPLSDILSAVFRQSGLRIGSVENVCIFPSQHAEFYDKNMPENERMERIFDECFANVFDLKANNSEHELEIMERLFGKEFMQTFENEIEQATEIYKREIEPDKNLNAKRLGMETLEEQKDVEYLLESQKQLSKENESKEKD